DAASDGAIFIALSKQRSAGSAAFPAASQTARKRRGPAADRTQRRRTPFKGDRKGRSETPQKRRESEELEFDPVGRRLRLRDGDLCLCAKERSAHRESCFGGKPR